MSTSLKEVEAISNGILEFLASYTRGAEENDHYMEPENLFISLVCVQAIMFNRINNSISEKNLKEQKEFFIKSQAENLLTMIDSLKYKD